MLGIFLIYWVGKKYYNLAGYYGKNEWGHAFMALGVYFGSQLILGLVLGALFPEHFVSTGDDGGRDLFLNLLGVGFGLLVWYIVFNRLESKYENELAYDEVEEESTITSIGEELE